MSSITLTTRVFQLLDWSVVTDGRALVTAKPQSVDQVLHGPNCGPALILALQQGVSMECSLQGLHYHATRVLHSLDSLVGAGVRKS